MYSRDGIIASELVDAKFISTVERNMVHFLICITRVDNILIIHTTEGHQNSINNSLDNKAVRYHISHGR